VYALASSHSGCVLIWITSDLSSFPGFFASFFLLGIIKRDEGESKSG